MNRCVFTGRLTRDPEVSTLQNGTTLAKFSLAVNEVYYKDGEKKENVNFFEMTAWGKQGESVSTHLKKGQKVLVEAKAKQETWQTKEGENRSKVCFHMFSYEFAGSSPNGNGHSQPTQTEDEEIEDNSSVPF